MARALKTRTWKDNWNNIIRNVFFEDKVLMDLMLVPEDTPITKFIDKYFIEDEYTDELITDELVRISYYDSKGRSAGTRNVFNKYKEFDIFVHETVNHTASDDLLQNRYDLIAERLKYLLQNGKTVEHLRFEYEDEYMLSTKMVGYKRYHLTFTYKITV